MVDLKNDFMFGNPFFGKMFEVNFGHPMPPRGERPMCHPHPFAPHHPEAEHPHPFGPVGPQAYHPHHGPHKHHAKTNIIENEADFVIELCVPGLKKEDFNLYVEKDFLNVETVIKEPNEADGEQKFLRKEFGFRSFKEVFKLPEIADLDSISAKVEDGILTITVAKKEKSDEVKKIEIA